MSLPVCVLLLAPTVANSLPDKDKNKCARTLDVRSCCDG